MINQKSNNYLSSVFRPPSSGFRGVALVAVLAVLVVLTILAASFSVMMNLELKQSNEQINSYQLDMLVDAGREHAKTLLTSINEPFRLANDKYTRWIYVKDKSGKVCGRYRLRIEDEAAKVNISKAYLLKDGKGTSWDTGEVNLPRALGLPTKFAKKIIRYRLGANWLPGGRGDDDHNNVVLMADGIDNDADGQVDEEDEGVNDPKEYVPENLKGDDRKFTTMSETLSILLGNNKPPLSIKQISAIKSEIPRRSTVYSIDKPGSPTLKNEKPSDINAVTARECQRRLSAANAIQPFEPNSKKRTQLAANMVDYRDENHVLSTLGSTYGVEAICFNEVLANDESSYFSITYGTRPESMCHRDPDKPNERYHSTTDNERPIYSPTALYCLVPSHDWHTIDPRHAWRVVKDEDEGIEYGGLKISGTITLPKAPGKKEKGEIKNYCNGTVGSIDWSIPKNFTGATSYERWRGNWCHAGNRDDYENLYEEMMKKLKGRGKADGDRPDLPNDIFKNAHAMIYTWQNSEEKPGKPVGEFKVTSSSGHKIFIENKEFHTGKSIRQCLNENDMDENNYDLSITFNAWGSGHIWAELPEVKSWHMWRSRQPIGGRYFKVVVNRQPYYQGWKADQVDKLGVSSNPNVSGITEDKTNTKQWWCDGGKPVRTDSKGWLDIYLTSSPELDEKRRNNIHQVLWYARMIAPEVAEMYNASATPISLANWRVICNTGSLATEIGRIKSTAYYDKKIRKTVIDDNPVVSPGGHFYLVNDTRLFDYWYGSGNGEWGSGPKEEIPVFQMDEDRWGVSYKIKSVETVPGANFEIQVKNGDWEKDMFDYETVVIIDEKNKNNPESYHGLFLPVAYGNKKNKMEFWMPLGVSGSKGLPESGSELMLLGLPYKGGIVSLTLKNEYEQICARTIDYGEFEANKDLGKSSEKIDPTKNTWKKRRKPSIGGYNKKALNKAMQSRRNEKFFIKNGPYGSIGEMRHVTTGDNFERLGGGSSDISKSFEAMGAIADVMCSSHVRLESCAGNVSRAGWKEAMDEVENSTLKSVTCKNGGWQPDKWKGQTLRFLTGKLRGEKFPILGNTKNVITLGDLRSVQNPYSAPNRMTLQPEKGDKFSIGPGYASALCFTRTGGESAEWTWKNALNVAQASRLTTSEANQNLYIYGLNDAIDTTEFFEENNNASLDVEVWNWKSQEFDKLCKEKRYGKQDSFNAGKINSSHISDSGDFRIRLTAHDVAERELEKEKEGDKPIVDQGGRQTGIAWFNYAVVTPVPVRGRVNVNTASARMLASLPGITQSLAKNIKNGINNEGKAKLKPYNSFYDLFKVKGMTPDIFERCANILALDSSIFTIDVEAEVLKASPPLKGGAGDVSSRKKIAPEDIAGMRRKRFVVELDKTQDNFFSVSDLEQYSP